MGNSFSTTSVSPLPAVPQGSFRYIPVLGNVGNADLRIVRLDGLSTKHGDAYSDRGTLYGSVTGVGGTFTVTLYADMERTIPILAGSTTTFGVRFPLTKVPGGGPPVPTGGVAVLASYTADDTDSVILPTFAVDEDVLLDQTACATFPGYDATLGLAAVHAQAMQEILGSILPSAVPHLYPTRAGISAFVPGQAGPALPDLRKLANAGQLRQIAALLVKAKANEQIEHLEEPAMVAKAARERLAELVKELTAANVQEEFAAETDDGSFEVGSVTRG